MDGDGGKRGMGRKNRDLHCSQTYVRDTHTSATSERSHRFKPVKTHSDVFRGRREPVCEEESSFVFSARAPGWVKKRKIKGFGKRGNGGRNTHIMYFKKCRLFWKYDYTNLRRKYKNYTNENYEVSCFLSWLGWVFFFFCVFLRKQN